MQSRSINKFLGALYARPTHVNRLLHIKQHITQSHDYKKKEPSTEMGEREESIWIHKLQEAKTRQNN